MFTDSLHFSWSQGFIIPCIIYKVDKTTKQKIVRFLPNNFWTIRQHSENVFLRECRCVILSILRIQCYTEYFSLSVVKLGHLRKEGRKAHQGLSVGYLENDSFCVSFSYCSGLPSLWRKSTRGVLLAGVFWKGVHTAWLNMSHVMYCLCCRRAFWKSETIRKQNLSLLYSREKETSFWRTCRFV